MVNILRNKATLLTKGVVLLDQIVTIDYNAREFRFVERITEELLDYLLNVTRRIFTK
jgi:mRNA interferase MazF